MSKLEKAETLLKEAETDLKHNCYNKAVSAAYFACRMLAEHIVESKGCPHPEETIN